MYSYFVSAWLCGLRSRSFRAVLVIGVVTIGIAYLAGAFSPRQPQTVVLDVGISGLRFSLVLLILFWIQELLTKEIERKTVYFSLAYPAPRHAYILGRYIAILVLSAAAIAFMGLLLWVAVLFKGSGSYEQQFPPQLGAPYWGVMFGIWLDVALVASFTLWVAALSTTSLMPIVCGLAFSIAGRSLGAVLDFIRRGADGDTEMAAQFSPVLDWLQWFIPDLSRLDWRVWSLYGQYPGDGLVWAVVAAVAYTGFFLLLGVISFSRREFT